MTNSNLNYLIDTDATDTPKIRELKQTYAILAEDKPENLLLYGQSSSGKSNTVKQIAYSMNAKVEEFQCSRWNNKMSEDIHAACLSTKTNLMFMNALDGKRHDYLVIILDEVDQVGTQGLEQLRGVINLYPEVVFMATTNFIERMPTGFVNRFWSLDLWDGVDYRELHREERLKQAKAKLNG